MTKIVHEKREELIMTNKKTILLHLVLGTMFLLPVGMKGQAEAAGVTIDVKDQATYDAVKDGSGNVQTTASSSDNTITVGSSSAVHVTGFVLGGSYHNSGDGDATASGNTVTITGGSTIDQEVYNEARVYGKGTATLSKNTITVKGDSTVKNNSVFNSSYVEKGTAIHKNNSITIQDSTINADIYNGVSIDIDGTGTMENAEIKVENSTSIYNIFNEVYMGDSTDQGNGNGDGSIKNSIITVTGSTIINSASNIKPNIENHIILEGTGNATIDGTEITVQDSTIEGTLRNYTNVVDTTKGNNTATVKNSKITGINNTGTEKIYNEAILSGDGDALASGNTILVDKSSIEKDVFNLADVQRKGTAKAENNKITVQGNSAVGAAVYNKATEYGKGSAEATGNSIIIDQSSVTNAVENVAKVIKDGPATVKNNTIVVKNNSTITGVVINEAYVETSGDGETSGNTITIENSTQGRQVYNAARGSGNMKANGNTISIINSTVNGDVLNSAFASDDNHDAEASNNTINITDSKVTGNVVVGSASSFYTATASNNTLNIRGTVDLTTAGLEGGYCEQERTRISENNTLNMYSKDVTAVNVANFNNYNFYLPAGTKAGDTMLTLTANAITDLTGAKADILEVDGGTTLAVDEKINLISNAAGVTVDPSQPTKATALANGSLAYRFDIEHDANNLYATVKGIGSNPQTESLLEGRLGASIFVNRGADLISENTLLPELKDNKTYVPIVAMEYGREKATTGSSVEAKGMNLLVGFGKSASNDKGTLYWAPFVEYGKGSYDTDNDFDGYDSVHGNGDTKYWGLGFMARQQAKSGNYLEGSIRVGRLSDEFTSDLSSHGKDAGYDITSTYYGAHIGIGKVFAQKNGDLDVFAKYFYNKVKGSDAHILDTDYDFDDTTSNKLKVGTKYTGKLSENYSWFGGLAWEYEFSGSQDGTVSGYDIPSPDYKGSTGVVTAGVKYAPDSKNYEMKVGLTDRFGKRKGLSGRVDFTFKL